MDNAEELVDEIISGKVNESETRKMYNIIVEKANSILTSPKFKRTGKEMIEIFKQLKEIFGNPKVDDKADDKTNDNANDEADEDEEDYESANEQPDTTDMPELESYESAEQ